MGGGRGDKMRNAGNEVAKYYPYLTRAVFSLAGVLSTHNSFFNTSVTELFEISARLKLVSVPLSSLLLHIVQ